MTPSSTTDFTRANSNGTGTCRCIGTTNAGHITQRLQKYAN